MAFVRPESKFVFDSRVAVALNLILAEKLPEADWSFMVPKGQSKLYKEIVPKLPERTIFVGYRGYCSLISKTALLRGWMGEDMQRVEMELFVLGRKDQPEL